MPRATVDTTPVHHDLKTCPGGFVELRRMPYGAWLTRSEMAMQMQFAQAGKKADMTAEVKMAQMAVTLFEFKTCIVDHNLEDDLGNKLDFNFPVALQQLDSAIGQEIGELINDLHKVDEGNSQTVSA